MQNVLAADTASSGARHSTCQAATVSASEADCIVKSSENGSSRSRSQRGRSIRLLLEGYQLVSDVKSLGQESAILLCRLQIEEKRLIIWGRAVGLAEETCRIPLQDLDNILTVLAEISSITQDAAVMKKRYSASPEPSNDLLHHNNPVEFIKSSAAFIDIRRRIDEKHRYPGHSLKTGLRWMFDRKNFEKLVVDLRELNNGLYALLEGAQRLTSKDSFREICLLTAASDDAKQLAVIRDASKVAYKGLSRTVDQRMHLIDIEASLPVEGPLPATRIPLQKLIWVNSDRARSIAHFEDEMVLVEWREYGDERINGRTVLSILDHRIAELSILLGRKPKPEGFQVMDCIGYCHDEHNKRFGLVYELPMLEVEKPPDIVSLYELLQPAPGADKVFPSLNDRFSLSRTLVNSVLQLHASGWLHRNLRSSHVLFIKSGKSMEWLRDPYICGFGYARINDPNAISLPVHAQDEEVAYQHPELTDNPRIGYKREYDAYSLGTILTEIAFWRPIVTFQKANYSAKRNHRRLLEYQLTGDLAHRMGQRFEQAVKLLLTGKGYGDSQVEGEQLVAFSQNIASQVDIQSLR
ncbi:prion-inhibition and propagation-domain-containing protein [Aspergillus heterothallicus]